MPTTFPASVDSFINPLPTDPTNSVTVPHATDQHSDANDAIEAIEGVLLGSVAANLSINGTLGLAAGSVSAPSLYKIGDTNTGLYWPAADQLAATAGGTNIWTASSSGLTIGTGQVLTPNGTAGAPSHSFSGDAANGMYLASADAVGIATAGVLGIHIQANQLIGLGTSAAADALVNISRTHPNPGAATNIYGLQFLMTGPTNATNLVDGLRVQVRSATAAYTLTNAWGMNIVPAVAGAGSTITNLIGLNIEAQTAGTTSIGAAIAAAGTRTLWLSNDANNTVASAGIFWGSSADTNLYRMAANVLGTDDQLRATDGIATKVVAGVVSDGSFTATPISGTLAIDTTNSRIYVRVGATWKFVAVV